MKQNDKQPRPGIAHVARLATVIGLTAWLISGATPRIVASQGTTSPVASSQIDAHARQSTSQQPQPSQQPQQPPSTPDAASQNAQLERGQWRVRVAAAATPGKPATLRVAAEDASLADVAADIGRQLRVSVTISTALDYHRVTLKTEDVELETALRLLAPRAYVDYVISGGSAAPPPLCRAIFLHGRDEPAPEPDAGYTTDIGLTLVEGNTDEMLDDGAANKPAGQGQTTNANKASGEIKEPPLRVLYANNKLSVRARRQSLTMVLYEISQAMEIPLDLQLASGLLVDVDFKEYGLEQAMRFLPAKAQLHLRTDLQTMTTTPLRFVLAAK